MSWTIAVEGGAIAKLPEEQRFADIYEPPRYEQKESLNDPSKTTEKLLIKVKLFNGNEAEYYPNKTSARKIASSLFTDLSAEGMKKWVGYRIFWGMILKQKVVNEVKDVLYVTDVKKIPEIMDIKPEKV